MVSIYSTSMTGVLSGAIVYEWTQEANDYGLITYPGTGTQNNQAVPSGSPVPIQPDFNNLRSQWAAASPVGTKAANYTPVTTTIACPAMVSGWTIDGNAALPPAPTTVTPPPPSTYVPTTHAPYPTAVTTASVSEVSSGISAPAQIPGTQGSASGSSGVGGSPSGASKNTASAVSSAAHSSGITVYLMIC